MTSPFKLPEDEYVQLASLQNRWNELTKRYGELHYQQKSITKEIALIDDALTELDTERFTVVTQMQEKYGVGQVNLVTGEFTPSEPPTVPDTP